MINHRNGQAINKYMKNHDPKQPSSYIMYLDVNNHYGWAMSEKLPVSDFKWMMEKQLENWKDMPCFLEVDLEYPEDLHEAHKDFPFCPERQMVDKVEKLIPNLCDKKNYVIHYTTLKQCLEHGLKLTKIYKGITFKESNKLKECIDKNTQLRGNPKNDFEIGFLKE